MDADCRAWSVWCWWRVLSRLSAQVNTRLMRFKAACLRKVTLPSPRLEKKKEIQKIFFNTATQIDFMANVRETDLRGTCFDRLNSLDQLKTAPDFMGNTMTGFVEEEKAVNDNRSRWCTHRAPPIRTWGPIAGGSFPPHPLPLHPMAISPPPEGTTEGCSFQVHGAIGSHQRMGLKVIGQHGR